MYSNSFGCGAAGALEDYHEGIWRSWQVAWSKGGLVAWIANDVELEAQSIDSFRVRCAVNP